MAEFYKFEITNWNEGTANLSLELEAAYLRVINAIRLADQAITFNTFVLCGLWRCNDRKAKRILAELIDAGKIYVEDGKLVNQKAADDASALNRLRADRASAGRRGGIESGKTRAKPLENHNTGEASASTREEKRRVEVKEEEREPVGSPKKKAATSSTDKPDPKGSRLPEEWFLPMEWGRWAVNRGLSVSETRRQADLFKNYWLAKAGRDARKVKWEATWHNWVIKAISDGAGSHGQRNSGSTPQGGQRPNAALANIARLAGLEGAPGDAGDGAGSAGDEDGSVWLGEGTWEPDPGPPDN
jgi:hypothetical protein